MAQLEPSPENPPAPIPDSLFTEHLKCSICLETLRIPVMTTIGCGHKFCETDIKTALTEDRRCPLCREEVRELFHDVFAEQMLEVYYKQNPNVVPRERCSPWTAPDPLAQINIGHGVFGGHNRPFNRINVQVMAPEMTQTERDEISNNIVRMITRENRMNEIAAFQWGDEILRVDQVNLDLPWRTLGDLEIPISRSPTPEIHVGPRRRRRAQQTARMTAGGRASSNPPRPNRRRGAVTSYPARRSGPPRQTTRMTNSFPNRMRAGPRYDPLASTNPELEDQVLQLADEAFPQTSDRALRHYLRDLRADIEAQARVGSSSTSSDASFSRLIRADTPPPTATPRRRRAQPTQNSSAPTVLRSGRVSQRPNLYGSYC